MHTLGAAGAIGGGSAAGDGLGAAERVVSGAKGDDAVGADGDLVLTPAVPAGGHTHESGAIRVKKQTHETSVQGSRRDDYM